LVVVKVIVSGDVVPPEEYRVAVFDPSNPKGTAALNVAVIVPGSFTVIVVAACAGFWNVIADGRFALHEENV
jgi:hypothetical protein